MHVFLVKFIKITKKCARQISLVFFPPLSNLMLYFYILNVTHHHCSGGIIHKNNAEMSNDSKFGRDEF